MKSSNISKWVFGVLALITVVIGVVFYLVVGNVKDTFYAGDPTPRTNLYLNWGYILIILGIVLAVCSAIFTGIVKGVKGKKLLFIFIAFAIIAVVAYVMSKAAFQMSYVAGEIIYSARTHGLVAFGLNFFYVTFGVALLSILFSVIFKAVKK